MSIKFFLGVPAVVLSAAILGLEQQWVERETWPASVVHASETGEDIAHMPPAPWGQAGPADSLYRLGREAINRNDFRRAAALFAEISAKYPRSEYAPDARTICARRSGLSTPSGRGSRGHRR